MRKYKNPNIVNSRYYSIWRGMKRRCYEESNKDYVRYGGRGIRVCDEWLDKDCGFINFYKWAVSNGYDNSLTLDRIDVNGNYEPGNCRWVTVKQQNVNTRVNRYITYNGETKALSLWAEQYGFVPETLAFRMDVSGLSFEDAISCKTNRGYVYVEYNDKVYTLKELAYNFNIPYGTVKYRHRKGWSIEEIINIPVSKSNRVK